MKKISKWTAALVLAGTTLAQAAKLSDDPLPTDDPKVVALYQAATKGDIDEAKKQISAGAAIDGQVGTLRVTALSSAADSEHVDMMAYLLGAGAKINQADVEGSTPLLHACWDQKMDCALALIDAGANVNLASNAGRTPLMYAAWRGSDRVIQDLLDHKVDVNANSNQGSAIHWAVSNGEMSTVKLLGDAGADVNLLPVGRGAIGYTPLDTAAANNNLEIINYLVDDKADINGAGAQGDTPVMAAADWRRPEAIEALIGKGANPDLKDKAGKTALMMATRNDDENCVRALIAGHADLDATDACGETALTQAGDIGDVAMVSLLKVAGAKRTDLHVIVKGPDGPGLTPPQAWALAVGAIYAQKNGYNPRVLGGNRTPKQSQIALKRDWKVTDTASLNKQLDDMRDHGHHEEYRTRGAQLAQMSDGDFAKLLADHPDNVARITAYRTSYQKWKERSGLAWDLCRAASIVGDGFCAHYLTAAEAWARLKEISATTQKSFGSWQELNENFLDGREIWAGQRDPRFDACSQLLLNLSDFNSPWNKSPWATNLAGN